MDFVPTFGSASGKQFSDPVYRRIDTNRGAVDESLPFNQFLKSNGTPTVKEPLAPVTAATPPEQPAIAESSALQKLSEERLQERLHDEKRTPQEILNGPKFPKLTENERNTLENMVRLRKRKRLKCTYAGINGECCKPDIRCGERAQFSGRETSRQQQQPHRCLYSPYFSGDNVIIVEPNAMMREFFLNTFKLFLNYDMEKIVALASAEEAMKRVQTCKLQNRQIGLLIVNVDLPGAGAYSLVNDMYRRNSNSEIILIGASESINRRNKSFLGDRELEPGLPYLSARLQTPVHTELLIEEIGKLHFGKFL